MRIELTVCGPDGRRDVAVVGEPAPAVGEVRAALAAAVGAPAGSGLWAGTRELDAGQRFGTGGLRTGAVLAVGGPGPAGGSVAGPALHVVGGPDAGHRVPLARGRLVIGRAGASRLVLADDRVSREHAALDVTATSAVLHDLGSANGTTVDGEPVGPGGRQLTSESLVRIGDTFVAVREVDLLPAALGSGAGPVRVNRAPRHLRPLPAPEIERPEGTGPAAAGRVPWLAALLPAAFGVGIAGVTGSRTFLLLALLSPVLLLSTALGDRVHWRRARRRADSVDRRARAAADRAVRAALEAEFAARHDGAPDPAVLRRVATTPGSRLWERHRGDADHLGVRLGPGELDSATRVRTGTDVVPAGRLVGVPFVVDLREGPLGITGPLDVIAGLVRWLVVQLAVLQSPADVQLVLLLGADTEASWTWARWLPHLRGVGTSAAEWQRLVAELAEELARRAATVTDARAGWSGLWLVLVLDRAGTVADVGGLAAVLARGSRLGVAAICIDRDAAALPTVTRITVRMDDDGGTRATVRGRASGEVVLDRVSAGYARQVSRCLAPLVDAGDDAFAGLPETVRLSRVLELDDVSAGSILRRWERSSGGADTVLGVTGEGGLHVDLATDGPHALVAGTTGSGKSELLRSWVIGLAATHPPDALTVLLVDYKGGAAFAGCGRLPHCVGLVTDLDPALTRRALVSFEAELRRRERCFAGRGADDLAAYRDAGGRGVARLVIVVDEFATLAEELPDFVRGLVGVAQRGRSLGVHLVLATQRPGAAVTPDIRANTSVRIALRVTDPAESLDVVDAPDAAAIDRRDPGRAYLRRGTRLIPFQTAGTSTRAEPAAGVEVLGPWRRRPGTDTGTELDDLPALVDAARAAAAQTGRDAPRQLWLDPLPASLPRTALGPSGRAEVVTLGRVDQPAELAQPELTLDLAAGRSVLLVGGPGSGRTSALLTLAAAGAHRLAPGALELYAVGSPALVETLGVLPHLAAAITPADPAAIGTVLTRLRSAIDHGAAGPASRLLLVDDWDAVLDSGDDGDRAAWSDALTGLLRSASKARLTVLTAGGRALLAARTSAAYDTRWLLPLVDPADYPLAGVAARDVPSTLPPGRGIRAADGAHFQLADPTGLDDLVRAAADRWAGAPALEPLVRVRPLPPSITRTGLPVGAGLRLGVVGDAARPFGLDPDTDPRLLVAGPPRSGRSTALLLLAAEAARLGRRVVIAAPVTSPLRAAAGGRIVRPGDELGPPPEQPTLLLVDDSEEFTDTVTAEALQGWLRRPATGLAAVVAGRSDELATAYRGLAAEVRRGHCGVLLRPSAVDGELLGVRLDRRVTGGPPGRGVIVGPRSWGPEFAAGEPVAIQIAQPEESLEVMCG